MLFIAKILVAACLIMGLLIVIGREYWQPLLMSFVTVTALHLLSGWLFRKFGLGAIRLEKKRPDGKRLGRGGEACHQDT